MKIYRLLRNNKEEGPFTPEELIQKNLKPYDLIWADGRSAAWRYPGEIAEFKNYVPLPADETAKQKPAPSTVSTSVQAAVAVNDAITQPASKQKPRYKVSAAWSKIQTVTAPVYGDVMVAPPQRTSSQKNTELKQQAANQSKSLSWEEAWLDWEKEKIEVAPTIAAPVKKVQPVTPQQKSINENFTAPVLETKYAEPLDSLKDKYIENILLQKQKSKKGFSFGKASEFVIPSIALIVIFSIAYWLLHDTKTAAAFNAAPVKTAPQTPANTNEIAATMNTNTATQTAPPAENNIKQKQNNISSKSETPIVIDQAEERKTNYVHTAKISSEKQPENKQQSKFPATQITLPDTKPAAQKNNNLAAKQFDPSVINNVPNDNTYDDASTADAGDLNAKDARPTRRRTNGGDAVADNSSTPKNDNVVTKTNRKPGTRYINVPEYIEMKDGSANLKIENVSDVDLDLVVVDVQYYDGSNRFRKGETLYLHNLRAGKNVVVKTPKDMNSMYATSKVSLVSSDAKNVYVIGDK